MAHHLTNGLSDALVVLGAAGLVIPTFARFRVNPVIGFILVGLLAGPHGLGSLVDRAPWLYYITITDPDSIEPFAELGIVLLLFSIGLELSFKRLWSWRRTVFGLGSAELIVSAVAIAAGLVTMGAGVESAGGLGIALALSSTALVLPMVGTQSPVGRAAFAMLLFEDLALVPIVFVLGALGPAGGEPGGAGAMEIVLVGVATIAAILLLGRFLLPPLFAQAARTKSPELFLSASLIVVLLAAVATEASGLSPLLGALLAGLLIAETDYHEEVEAIVDPFKGLGLGMFLITVGMRVDLPALLPDWPSLALAVAGVLGAKIAVTAGLLRLSGFRAGVAAETGLLMASPSETTLIVLGTLAAAGLVSAPVAAFWQSVTAIGLILTPLLAAAGPRIARMVERKAAAPADLAEAEVGGDRVIVIGLGRVGRLVAQMLDAHDLPYLAIDADVDAVTHARERGYHATLGDIRRHGMIDRLNLAASRAVVLTMDDPVLVGRITAAIRKALPDLTLIARARDPNQAAQLYRAGATDAVPETLESSLQLSEAVLVDLGVPMGRVIASIHEKRAELRAKIMKLAEIDREPPIRRTRLRDRSSSVRNLSS